MPTQLKKPLHLTRKNKLRNLLILLPLCLLLANLASFIPQTDDDFFDSTENISPSIIPTNTPEPTQTPPKENSYQLIQKVTDSRRKKWLEKIPATIPLSEYLVVVNIPEQKEYIFHQKELIRTFSISTGKGEEEMREGLWQIQEKRDENLGEIYGPRLLFLGLWNGENFQRTNIALHGTNEPQKIGTNFGLGCIYHLNQDILDLYDLLPEETLVITTNETQENDWQILLGGTVVLSRGVDERIRRYNNINYPWEEISSLTQSADLSIVNLKSPFTENCPYIADQPVFCGQAEYIQGMEFAQIDLVSLAGNHLGDYGPSGIEFTIDLLKQTDIYFSGAGRNQEEAFLPIIYELTNSQNQTLKIGFLAFNTVNGTSPFAQDNQTGIAGWTEEIIREKIGQLEGKTDLIIVMPNWGIEYTHQPTEDQIRMGHQLIDWGADIIAGDQAHWVQKIEEYQDGIIFYGLGNLIFDQMWSQKTREGLLVEVNINPETLNYNYELLPVILENYAQPRLADETEKKQIISYTK